MRDIDVITKAMDDAQAILNGYIESGERDPKAVLRQMLDVLQRDEVLAAHERLCEGYGHLRLVK